MDRNVKTVQSKNRTLITELNFLLHMRMKESDRHRIMQKMARNHQRQMDKKKLKKIEAKGDMSQEPVASDDEK